eukprot:SAG11_NODE_2400_length_3402_cov_46.821980_2_plen_271_part_00
MHGGEVSNRGVPRRPPLDYPVEAEPVPAHPPPPPPPPPRGPPALPARVLCRTMTAVSAAPAARPPQGCRGRGRRSSELCGGRADVYNTRVHSGAFVEQFSVYESLSSHSGLLVASTGLICREQLRVEQGGGMPRVLLLSVLWGAFCPPNERASCATAAAAAAGRRAGSCSANSGWRGQALRMLSPVTHLVRRDISTQIGVEGGNLCLRAASGVGGVEDAEGLLQLLVGPSIRRHGLSLLGHPVQEPSDVLKACAAMVHPASESHDRAIYV